MGLLFEAAAVSDAGPRANNQDAAAADGQRGFALVADGMGGAAGGEVASAQTLDAVRQGLERTPPGPGQELEALLTTVVAAAQGSVLARAAAQPELQGMGSTLALVVVAGEHYGVANVGDSRVYLLRAGVPTQLSHDHSLVQERVDRGALTPAQAALQPDRNVITRVLGAPGCAQPHLAFGGVRPGDRFLVTSDGVHGVLTAADLVATPGAEAAGATAQRLVRWALQRGTTDNASVAVLRVLPAPPRGGLAWLVPWLGVTGGG